MGHVEVLRLRAAAENCSFAYIWTWSVQLDSCVSVDDVEEEVKHPEAYVLGLSPGPLNLKPYGFLNDAVSLQKSQF